MLRALTSADIPAGGSPPQLCTGATCSWWGWTFGAGSWCISVVCTVLLSVQQSCRNPCVLSHCMENPFCKDTGLYKSCLGSCSSGSAPVPGVWIVLTQSTMGFLAGFAAVILSWRILTGHSGSLLGLSKWGLFQFGVSFSPYNLLLNQAFQYTELDVNLLS